ncbi:MAG TPA: MMPL family transporter [Dehalococcoidia bacterium]|nr:MMPL family transporter [Dehalococcoidia bacterium]
MFIRLAAACYRRRRAVLASWVVLVVLLLALANVFGGVFKTEFKLPGSESQQALDILKDKGFGTRAGVESQIVFQSDSGVNDPTVRQAMEGLFARIQQNVSGASVVSPYSTQGAHQIAPDGKTAYAQLNLSDRTFEQYQPIATQIKQYRNDVHVSGLQVELGGDLFASMSQSPSEAIGIIGAVIILLIAFGSLLAVGLPILTALFGIGCGIAVVELASRYIAMPGFTSEMVAMISIGVGIDYALFIVTRYREGLHSGMEPEAAVVRSLDTAGRAVLFAGGTVVISVLGLFAMNQATMSAVAIAAAFGVLMTMLAALTLLPAILGFVGRNVDRFGLPNRSTEERSAGSFWFRWSRVIQRHPWPALVAGLAVLVMLALPVFSMRLGFADAGSRPTSDTTRKAYDLLSAGFGPGFNGPLLIAAETPGGASDQTAMQGLSDKLNQTAGVAFASAPITNQQGDAAIIQVYPATAPQDAATSDLVSHLRDDVVPSALDGSTVTARVGGQTAGAMDFSDFTARHLPLVMGVVLLLSFTLLTLVFRSVVVPLKAVLMNLLSIGAAYGILVAVFQWGWLAGVIGVSKSGPIDAWVPIMLFAIVFGLSMDYEVFLLSRVREEYDRNGRNNGLAVADGLAATARVITAAAAIMVCVFMSFALGSDRSIKLFGLGLASAIFLDATLVRMVLVPATMELLGDLNWWLPGWLGRVLPVIHVDATEPAPLEAVGAE